jgi:hypothetical protein
MAEIIPNTAPRLHVRFQGRSWDLLLSDLDLGPFSSDAEVCGALAGYLGVPTDSFKLYVIEHHTNGNITVRPEAVFGS